MYKAMNIYSGHPSLLCIFFSFWQINHLSFAFLFNSCGNAAVGRSDNSLKKQVTEVCIGASGSVLPLGSTTETKFASQLLRKYICQKTKPVQQNVPRVPLAVGLHLVMATGNLTFWPCPSVRSSPLSNSPLSHGHWQPKPLTMSECPVQSTVQ